MLYGYNGKMLFVDLTDGKIEEKELTKDLAENFLSGYGLGAKILYNMMPAGVDPLGPENVIGIVPGVTNGTRAFFGGRYTVVYKSPVSGGWSDANSGGFFGPELKKAGYDAVFVSGISKDPVYLWINDGKVEIRDASHLWGMDAKQTWEALKTETGDKTRVLAIGPAGEHMSLLSCPINDGHRAPARGGIGAVMGSKKLKAIAARGTGNIPIADPARLTEINKELAQKVRTEPHAIGIGQLGSGGGTTASLLSGDSPVKNWSSSYTDTEYGEKEANKVSAIAMDRYKTKKYNCSACPLGCGAEYEANDGRWPLEQTERPEYETASAFGSNLLNSDSDVLLKCNEICNIYGFDTISAGMTVAWAMECYNENVLTKEDLDGLDLTWGNGEAIVALLQKMADAEGCGKILANGSAYAAEYYGKGKEFLVTASGIELPMHDPRKATGLARIYKYDPTPGRHTKGGVGMLQMGNMEVDVYHEDTAAMDVGVATNCEITDMAGFCTWDSTLSPPSRHNDFIEAITGMKFDDAAAYTLGLRILYLRYAFNLREGIKPSDMTLSKRVIGDPPLTNGPTAGVSIDVETLGRNFFRTAGIDFDTGKPFLESLQQVGHLDEVIKDLYGDVK